MKPLFFLSILLLGLFFTACKEKVKTNDPAVDSTEDQNVSNLGGTYTIDPATSEVRWKGAKPTGEHNGMVPISSGTVTVADGNITGGTIEIDMTGITVLDLEGENKATLEAHLKGETPGKEQDFFNVDKFPKATYVINSATRLENDPDGTHMINGNLTIKDITKPVNFKANVTITADKLSANTPEFMIDRTEYDIRFKSKKFFNNLQDDFVNDEFKLKISVNAMKQE